jgi:hypothetical protein
MHSHSNIDLSVFYQSLRDLHLSLALIYLISDIPNLFFFFRETEICLCSVITFLGSVNAIATRMLLFRSMVPSFHWPRSWYAALESIFSRMQFAAVFIWTIFKCQVRTAEKTQSVSIMNTSPWILYGGWITLVLWESYETRRISKCRVYSNYCRWYRWALSG